MILIFCVRLSNFPLQSVAVRMEFLRVSHISKSYKDTFVLKDINVLVSKGERIAISGETGSGKTTLLNRLLREANGRRLAVLVNDFGSLPIDRDLIEDALRSVARGTAHQPPKMPLDLGSDATFAHAMPAAIDRAQGRVAGAKWISGGGAAGIGGIVVVERAAVHAAHVDELQRGEVPVAGLFRDHERHFHLHASQFVAIGGRSGGVLQGGA